MNSVYTNRNKIVISYSNIEDLRRCVYWTHRLQNWSCTLSIKDVDVENFKIVLQFPSLYSNTHTVSNKLKRYFLFEKLFSLGIVVHPSRTPLSDDCFWIHSSHGMDSIYIIDFSGFVSCEHNIASFAQAPKTLSYSRYPYLQPFSVNALHIGIFIQIGSMSYYNIISYIQNIICTRNDKITILCSMHDTFSCFEQEKIKRHIHELCTLQYRIDIPIHFISVPNTGMDIGAFLRSVQFCEKSTKFDVICKIHTKSDTEWRRTLCDPILDDVEKVQDILRLFTNIPDLGCCAANRWILNVSEDVHNHDIVSEYCSRLNFTNPYTTHQKDMYFVGGTIFWLRWSIIQNIIRKHNTIINEAIQKFEKGYIKNTTSTHTHAWERLLGIIVTASAHEFIGF